jgi:hypothetical protein
MAVTSSYKEYQRLERVMTVEDAFNLGMSYINTPLNEGFARLLVNFDLKNQSNYLVPRGGIKTVTSDLTTIDNTSTYAIHHIGTMLVQTADEEDATVHKYILLLPVVQHAVMDKQVFSFTNAYLIIQTAEGYISEEFSFPYYTALRDKLDSIHGVEIQGNKECNKGISVSIEANTYIPVFDVEGRNRKFVRLMAQFNAQGGITVTLPTLEPKEIPASQVINSGYNMLKDDPYDFENTENATGALVLGGIIPKDVFGNIKLTAEVGETLIYNLAYTYPPLDLNEKYMVQWEIKDTTTGAETVVIQQVRKSPVYVPGDDITLSYTVPYRQFTMVVKVYYKKDVDAHEYVSDVDDYNNLAPLKVITVSSYYTTANVANTTANLSPKNYDLSTCTDMCVWQQRAVMWGVKDAATTLFVSQANLPEYVPYPNNVEVFTEDIVTCVPYLTNLLVFTTSKLYKMTLVTDGATTYYTTKCIQEHLPMTKADASTMQVVKNMLYFKSNNYFYMIVPNINAGIGELQLAPVSRPIEGMLDNFEESLYEIIGDTYNIKHMFDIKEANDDSFSISLIDYHNYMEGGIVRNVYKCKLNIYKMGVLNSSFYLDFVLNYDTVSRAWSTYLYESTQHRMLVYENTVTTGMLFASILNNSDDPMDNQKTVRLFTFEANSPKDEAVLTATGKARTFKNHQLLDTGYRAHYPAYKKRFREIQFTINNTDQATLNFYTGFTMDDDTRKQIFEYEIQQITDTESPDYGLIYVERSLADPLSVYNKTAFDTEDPWRLDFSRFPTITVVKARYKVSGKGYLGKIKLLSVNETVYELLGTNWVYRKMNAR